MIRLVLKRVNDIVRILLALVSHALFLQVTLIGIMTPSNVHSAPFSCTGDVYQVQSGQLRIFDPTISAYVDVGTNQGGYNATGFNVADNYAYAYQGGNGGRIIRIEDDGSTTNAFTNIGFSSFAADVGANNIMWLRTGNARQYTAFNLITGVATPVTVPSPNLVQGGADLIMTTVAGTEYLLTVGGDRIMIVDVSGIVMNGTAQTVTSVRKEITGLEAVNGSFGAQWSDAAGRIFIFNNTNGRIYEIFNAFGASPSAVEVAQGDPSGSNDGFSCPAAPFPNLPPIARDDFFTTPIGVAVSGDVLLSNGNLADEDPEGQPLAVSAAPLSSPSNGSLIWNGDGTFTYTPNAFFVGTDTFTYSITDTSGLSATATVTIAVPGTQDFTLTKTQSGGPNPITTAGQIIEYEIVITNIGDTPLNDVVITDTLPDGSNASFGLPSETGSTAPVPSVFGQLDINEIWTYTTSYTVTQADIDSGATLTNNVAVSTDIVPEKTASAATTITQPPASLEIIKTATVVKTAPNTGADAQAGDVINYVYRVTNDGGLTLTNIDIADVHSGSDPFPDPDGEALITDNGIANDSNDTATGNNGVWDVLAPNDVIEFYATYTVTQQDIDAQ